MTWSDPAPAAPEFPRLYDPEAALTDAELSQPVTLPFGAFDGPPSVTLTATAGAFGPQYLVLLQGVSEDLPLGLFADRDEAVEFAREVRFNPDGHADKFYAVTGRDPLFKPRWIGVSVVEFQGPIPTVSTPLFDLDH